MKMKPLLILFSCLLLLNACRKDPDLSDLSTNLAVITNRSKDARFNAYKTYFISDTVRKISGTDDTLIVGNTAAQLVGAIVNNMNARGYTRVADGKTADMVILSGVLTVDVSQTVIYPGWWWGYYPYWGYGGYYGGWYGGYYPYYPYGGGATYNYTVGSMIIDMFDRKNSGTEHRVNALWTTYMAGYLNTTTATNVGNAVEGINQAFKQSTYISAQ